MRTTILFLISIILAAGCVRTADTSSLEVDPVYIICGNEGGEYEIHVTGPSGWVTDNTADWISVKKNGGDAIVTIDRNDGEARERTLNFTCNTAQASLKINQESSDIFSIDASSLHCSHKGGSFQIHVECYDDWTVSSGNQWISLSTSGGNAPLSVAVTIEKNEGKDGRSGQIEFHRGHDSHTVSVTQEQSPYIALEKDLVETDGDGGTFRIMYISNTEVSITSEDKWIRLIDSGSDEKVIAFEVLRNISDERRGSIKVTSLTDPMFGKELTVVQGKKVDHPSIVFEEGYAMDVSERGTFRLNPVFTDMTDTSLEWSSDSPDIASIDQNGNVTVHTGGECRITAWNRFHDVKAEMDLNIRLSAISMTIMLGSQDMEESPVAVRYPGERMTVTVNLVPEDAYFGDLVCISSDPAVAKAEDMTVTCISPGSVTISVESLYHGMRKSFSLIVLED